MVPLMEQTSVQSKSCPYCAAQMPEAAAFCPGCGRSMQPATRAEGKVGILPESIAGGLAYLSFVPAIVFLFVDPYRRNRFVRFHSLQCILFWVAAVLLALLLKLAGMVLFMIPVVGPLLVLLIERRGQPGRFLHLAGFAD